MTTKVKICGITNKEDALLAAEHGADYLGVLIDVTVSPRSKTIQEAKEIFASSPIPVVALVYKMQEERIQQLINELKPFAIQFVVQEDISFIRVIKEKYPQVQLWQSLHLPAEESFNAGEVILLANQYSEAGVDIIVMDTLIKTGHHTQYGGTGKVGDWELIAEILPKIKAPIYLAGGLTPENVVLAINTVRPAGVDVSSGLETTKAKKDLVKLKEFIGNIRNS